MIVTSPAEPQLRLPVLCRPCEADQRCRDSGGPVRDGLHEQLLTRHVRRELEALADLVQDVAAVDPADQAHVLARHLSAALVRALESASGDEERADLANAVLALLEDADWLDLPIEQLVRLTRTACPGVFTYPSTRPSAPLSEVALLTNSPHEPSLGAEIKAEMASADDVALLCAFVKWHGLRLLDAELARLRDRAVPLRVITSTYMGATERVALDRLVRDFDAEVRVQYDIRRTRLHAKAWLFSRATGFDTAYVGSSNLSRSAMLDGLEWNVRLSRVATPTLTEKFRAVFDTYWNDATYELYDPELDGESLDEALAEAGGLRLTDRVTVSLSGLAVRPYPHQA